MNNEWKENLNYWPGSLPSIEVKGYKASLIIIDMQNYYVHEDGQFLNMLEKKYPDMYEYFLNVLYSDVIPAQVKLLNYFRQKDFPVFHIRVGALLPNGKDQFKRRALRDQRRNDVSNTKQGMVKGSIQHEIIEQLKPLENEFVLDKNSSSAFNSTAIDQLLRNTGSEFLVIGGILTNNCVESTARDAADKGYNVVLIEDGCTTLNNECQNVTYRTFARSYGMVSPSSQIIKKIEESLESDSSLSWSIIEEL